ncbi:hypothetical protein C1T17_05580 [Sphingobium sp. SCG-1]|uniref:glycine zipper 2TM domain-containing protein n=1 Tax=Sphingobium sp. SCG-1 TaxID=2072936 RepID=UPI000CD693D0|nr:glycine zipper 2TM domain-containing protein [Sphingobium sp. SCG-1]AUW57652.1 hypothetical protein C1T17_05580 [Sphingobium sp. SCG-1]
MKKMLLSLMLAATTLTATPALADPPGHAPAHGWRDKQDRRDDRREWRQDRRDDRRDNRREARRDARDWRQYRNYDYNRAERRGERYYADNYYRDGRYYQPQRLSRNSRIYRGNDNRYYCRRSDGTTGLIIGAAAGGLLGNSLDRGGSSLLGTLLGAGGGALLGREIDRGGVSCR